MPCSPERRSRANSSMCRRASLARGPPHAGICDPLEYQALTHTAGHVGDDLEDELCPPWPGALAVFLDRHPAFGDR